MSGFLEHMAAGSRERLEAARRAVPESELRARVLDAPSVRALDLSRFLLIAEIKRVSPAEGPLESRYSLSFSDRIEAYEAGGAGAISVLTEPSRFGGSLSDLAEASRTTGLPVMRKDFLVDPYQVVEARAAGASGVLLIVRMLDDHQLRNMVRAAGELGMFALAEAFDRGDAERLSSLLASGEGAIVLPGVNARDLDSLGVRPGSLSDLRKSLPESAFAVAESGMSSGADVAGAVGSGYRGVLVGSALMKSNDPGALCRAMVDAGEGAL